MSAVENLSAWCRSMCLPPPDLSSTLTRDDRHRAVVRLSNGHVFNGSFAKSEMQAMESAAGVALLQLTKGQNFPAGGFPPHGPPPGHFGGPPMFLPGGPPFPAGPPFSGGPPPPGPHPQQQGQQGGPPPRLSASPNSAFTPVRQQMGPNAMPNMPGMPPFPAWDGTRPMFPPPPHFGPPPPHHQQRFHQRNQQPRGQAYQGQGHQPRGQGHGIPPGGFQSPPKQQRDRRNQDGRQGQQGGQQGGPATEATTPKKQNPFVPFQVMQKQKTPQKDSRKDDSEGKHDRSSSPEVTPPKPPTAATLAATEPSLTTAEHTPQPAKTPTKPATGSAQKPTPSKDSANRPPARRPKSRIAAKFNAL